MKKSIQKLRKFFRLEADRGYDNKAVMGGLSNILSNWELEAREDQLPEPLIQAVVSRLRDYHRLSQESRKVALRGVWKRIKESTGTGDSSPPQADRPAPAQESTSQPEDGQKPEETPSEKKAAPEKPERPASAPESEAESKPGPDPDPKPEPDQAASAPPSPPPFELDSPVTEIKGVGAKRAQALQNLGVEQVQDLIYTFPRRHDDYSQLKTIDKLRYGEEVTIIGTIQNVSTRKIRSRNMTLVEAVLSDKSGSLQVTWFNQPWLEKQLKRAGQIVLSGKVEQYLGKLTMTNPDWEPLSPEQLHTNRIVPVYPLTENLNQKWLRKTIHRALKAVLPLVDDPLPESVRTSAELVSLPFALKHIHFPDSQDHLHRAFSRLAFDEIFKLQMGVLRQKMLWENRSGRRFESPDDWMDRQLARLPYTLTEAQQRALQQIREDFQSGQPMNRLLQGDVGSGKTVVAAMAILIVAREGAQSALMAPTSILAEQHYLGLRELLSEGDSSLQADQIRLLIGSTPEPEKEAIREGLEAGTVKLVIGTHALLQDPVVFDDLQLAIIDEQHRFGVEQRGTLRQKGSNPHLLVMTATPIPRSLALTIYGDLDITVIDELPPGRQEVDTFVRYPRERERVYNLIKAQVDKGNQAFIIYPLVEESDQSQDRAAVEEYERLQDQVFANYRLGLLHGRLHPEEKEAVMAQFREGETDILISTSVIEVGVDIPQATVMLIEGAHRFGLAQLHQFRGRVGRGDQKAYCILIPGDAEEVNNQRLQAMEKTNDGFQLAELDLKQRGPGQFLGTRQSGYTELQLAEITDLGLIEKARRAAQQLMEKDPQLTQEQHQALAEQINRFWTQKQGGDVS
jgi:ATP-dependent DNA helicase RecG